MGGDGCSGCGGTGDHGRSGRWGNDRDTPHDSFAASSAPVNDVATSLLQMLAGRRGVKVSPVIHI